jgi:hypothetical protein
VVQEHILEVRESLPTGYYRELPELAGGALAGHPRVYEIAIALISHTEARVELDDLNLFVAAFQEVAPLRIGELWALPAMLRLGLIESVRRMALRSVRRLEELESADAWAARLGEAAADGDGRLERVLAEFLERPPDLSPTFVARFLQQLRFRHGATPRLRPLELWVAEQGMSAEDASGRATERVALTQVMMSNSITSLRAIARMDWETFVEAQSALERELRRDPAGIYPRMTFATRDRYRHVVERIAKRTGRDEAAVAREAVGMSVGAADQRARHVGYFLVDDGLRDPSRRPDIAPLHCSGSTGGPPATRTCSSAERCWSARWSRSWRCTGSLDLRPSPRGPSSCSSRCSRRTTSPSTRSTSWSPPSSRRGSCRGSISPAACRLTCAPPSWCRRCSAASRRSRRRWSISRCNTSPTASPTSISPS